MEKDRKTIFSQSEIFLARFENLRHIGGFIVRLCRNAGIDEEIVYKIQLAVDEACSNIIEHAYGNDSKGEINCSCTITNDEIIIVLEDSGKTFDPASIPKPDLNSELEKRNRGGLGIYFIQQIMDSVTYHTMNKSLHEARRQRNILVLTKRIVRAI